MRILITGAGRGIGKALHASYDTGGDTVIATARNAPGLIALDVTEPASLRDLAATLDGAPLDLLVCNAGIYIDKGQNIDTGFAPDLWADTFATNVAGVFLTIQALLPNLRAAPAPKIAILSSEMGSSAWAAGGSYIYRASKAAALNLGRNLAVDLKPEGIAVGIYHPGWVRTEMGGRSATLSVEDSAGGLKARFAALSLATSGCFEMWNGEEMPF